MPNKKDDIAYPVNVKTDDINYFKKCLSWEYWEPAVTKTNWVIIYPKGYCTDILLRPVKNIAPWEGFYKKYNKRFFIGQLIAIIRRSFPRINLKGNYYYCINEFSDNYFHWLTEVLPKMIYVKENMDNSAVFLIPFPLKDYQKTSLEYCGIRTISFKDKILFSPRINIVENFAIYPGIYNPEILLATKKSILSSFENKKEGNRRVYITRKNANRRKVLNEKEVLEVVENYAFEILDFDLISFEEQVKIIRETSLLISIHGAALTSMIFLPENSKIIEFMPAHIINNKCYFILAGTLKIDYYYIHSELNGKDHINSDYTVDINQFCNLIKELLVMF